MAYKCVINLGKTEANVDEQHYICSDCKSAVISGLNSDE